MTRVAVIVSWVWESEVALDHWDQFENSLVRGQSSFNLILLSGCATVRIPGSPGVVWIEEEEEEGLGRCGRRNLGRIW